MAVSTRTKASRKTVMVRVFCVVMVLLLVVPLLVSTLLSGYYW